MRIEFNYSSNRRIILPHHRPGFRLDCVKEFTTPTSEISSKFSKTLAFHQQEQEQEQEQDKQVGAEKEEKKKKKIHLQPLTLLLA